MKINDFLFVYGTLRPDHIGGLKADVVKNIGPACLPGAVLYDFGPFPGLVLRANSHVHGYVVQITDENLPRRLDRYEGYPNLFSREVVEVTTDSERGSQKLKAWVYTFNRDLPEDVEIVPDGDWLNQLKRA